MPQVKSEKKVINSNQKELFEYLSDFRNFENLMPEQVENWKADKESCSFTIQGLADVEMRISEKMPHHKIIMVSEGKTPYPFELLTELKALNEEQTEAEISIDAKMNPMLAMMAERPLKNLVQIMVEKLQEIKG